MQNRLKTVHKSSKFSPAALNRSKTSYKRYNSYHIGQKSAPKARKILGFFHQLRKPPLIDPQSELRGGVAFLSGIPLIRMLCDINHISSRIPTLYNII